MNEWVAGKVLDLLLLLLPGLLLSQVQPQVGRDVDWPKVVGIQDEQELQPHAPGDGAQVGKRVPDLPASPLLLDVEPTVGHLNLRGEGGGGEGVRGGSYNYYMTLYI